MSTWIMNAMWRRSVAYYQSKWMIRVQRCLSIKDTQIALMNDLKKKEGLRMATFALEKRELLCTDVLKKAMIRAEANAYSGKITMAEYFTIKDKVDSLKKLQFSEEWKLHEPEVFEWMKHKIAADVGGTEEREAFHLYELGLINDKGEVAFRLWRKTIYADPQSNILTTII